MWQIQWNYLQVFHNKSTWHWPLATEIWSVHLWFQVNISGKTSLMFWRILNKKVTATSTFDQHQFFRSQWTFVQNLNSFPWGILFENEMGRDRWRWGIKTTKETYGRQWHNVCCFISGSGTYCATVYCHILCFTQPLKKKLLENYAVLWWSANSFFSLIQQFKAYQAISQHRCMPIHTGHFIYYCFCMHLGV